MRPHTEGFAPKDIRILLRIEGLAVLAATLVAYQAIGGNWWLFAALLLAPDLAMFGALAGRATGARIYNLAHTYTAPALLGGIGLLAGWPVLTPLALIWIAHIGMDRAVGYGLKYPGLDHATHLGWIGKAKHKGAAIADPS